MSRIERLANSAKIRRALDGFAERRGEFIKSIISVQQIPAPTFSEEARATFVEARFKQLGLKDVRQDRLHNVYGRFPGADPKVHRPVIISAHSDTVFPLGTDLSVRREGRLLYGPGIGDNAAGVAGLFAIAEALDHHKLKPAADIWFVSNVGEEGLGNLRGMREVVKRFGRHATYIVVEGGLFGQIAHEAVGVRRLRIDVSTPGGHSWGGFGNANAIHELAHIITAIDRLNVSDRPKTTYNVGVIEGGTTVNTIAAHASMLLDLRSESSVELDGLVARVMDIIHQAQRRAIRNNSGATTGGAKTGGVRISVEQVGERPAGNVPRTDPLVCWTEEALIFAGSDSVTFVSGSTDANIPLSLGIPAVCVGLTESVNSHRLDEYIDTQLLSAGLKQLLLLVLAAGDYRPRDS